MTNPSAPKILINCSNLHVGGAVAVASSFIDCLSRFEGIRADISLLISSLVLKNLNSLGTDTSIFKSVVVLDCYGIKSLWQGVDKHFIGQDVVFTVFGPSYFLFKRTHHLFGFAQPSIIYPNNSMTERMGLIPRLKLKAKFKLQELFFSRADQFVVELEHVKVGLERLYFFQGKPIDVVYSTVDSVFSQPERWQPVAISDTTSIKLGIISRNYPHKNLACLPMLKQVLRERHSLAVDFFVTFPEQEWKQCTPFFRANIVNVGPLTLTQCPSFYTAMDGVIFPSLLECFSAVPIETMMMKRPLFASDLPFIRDCCHEHAHYFDPLNVDAMADVIADYYSALPAAHEKPLADAYDFVQGYPGPNQRAQAYLDLVLKAAAQR